MKKTLIAVAAAVACVIGLGVANEAKAGVVVRASVGKHYGHDRGPSYYRDHGVHYSGGYYFRGRNHDHWGHRVWDSHYHRYNYWEPNLRIYYYYDAGLGGYYPCR